MDQQVQDNSSSESAIELDHSNNKTGRNAGVHLNSSSTDGEQDDSNPLRPASIDNDDRTIENQSLSFLDDLGSVFNNQATVADAQNPADTIKEQRAFINSLCATVQILRMQMHLIRVEKNTLELENGELKRSKQALESKLCGTSNSQ
ncbi:hypothetical protein VNI00_019457 [Paramarasmius palmivorus]|uniref:Uncharacterized protein n=1 Tax=Paramarasmius palmivorus TaxID=297713 RepID=A0AAW0AL49_9AGAR